MSNLAASFYGGETARMNLTSPDIEIFNGSMKSLMPDTSVGVYISVRNPGMPGMIVAANLAKVRDSVFPYVMEGNQEPESGYDKHTLTNNNKHAASVVGKMLVPSSIATGRLFDINVEAVAPQEVIPGFTETFQPHVQAVIGNPEAHSVFFMVTAMLKTTVYTPRPLAGIAIVYCNRSHTPSPCFVTTSLGPSIIQEWFRSGQGE